MPPVAGGLVQTGSMAEDASDILILTAEIAASYLEGASHVKAEEIPDLIRSIRSALSEGDAGPQEEAPAATAPKMHSATVRKSITPDGLISFIDGKSYKTLKRHVGRHGHDMKSYREEYGLPSDYPSVAPNYSALRSDMAKSRGLGARRKGSAAEVEAAPAASKGPSGRGRKKVQAPREA